MKKCLVLLLALLICTAGALAEALEPNPTLEPVQPLRSCRIRAVGDLMVHKKQLEIAKQADGSYDFHPQYALIADSLADADYTIANLETTIGRYENRPYSGYPMFNTPESLLDAVRDAGVDFLTLANNHMLDRYFEGMVKTADNVEAWGFDFGGANRTPQEKEKPNIVEVNGIRLGFLCYTQMTNGMEDWSNAAVKEYGVNYLRKADLPGEVRALREAGADVVIAIPHWGEEYFRRPQSYIVTWAKKMVAAGVDVVLGSHPHMVQPVEFVEAEGHRGLVAYSLGNFIDNMLKRYTDSGIILEFTVQETQDGGFAITNVGIVPVYCWKQDANIQTVASLKYLDEPPEGMSSGTWQRMKDSYWELRDLIDDSIPMLVE